MDNPFEMIQQEMQKIAADVCAIKKQMAGDKSTLTKKDLLDLNSLINYIAERTGKVYSKATIYRYTSTGMLKFVKPGKELFFEVDVIDRWLMGDRPDPPAVLRQDSDKLLLKANKRRLRK